MLFSISLFLASVSLTTATSSSIRTSSRQGSRRATGCVDSEYDLRRALDHANAGDRIEICKRTEIPIYDHSIDLTHVAPQVTLGCQNDDNCSIVGYNTPNLFSGTPRLFAFDYIEFENDTIGKYFQANGACHNYADYGDVSFTNCKFSHCKTEGKGGAIYARYSAVHVDKSYFYKNFAKKNGGAIWLSYTNTTVTDTSFEDNESYANGGGVSDYRSPTLSLLNVKMDRNYASGSGGATALNESKLALYWAKLDSNRAQRGDGGAIYDAGKSTLAVDESKFLHNFAKDDGGAVFVKKSFLSASNTKFERNVAHGQGGAIYDAEKSHVIISKCDFWYNIAPYSDAGALNLDNSFAVITSSNFVGNFANRDGGAIDDDSGTSYVVIANTQFKLNEAKHDGGCAEFDYSLAAFYAVDMFNNTAGNNGGCLNVLDNAKVSLRKSNFERNHAYLGNDIFLQDDQETFVKCNDHVVFCDGVDNGIKDAGHVVNTNCDKVAQDDGDFCRRYH